MLYQVLIGFTLPVDAAWVGPPVGLLMAGSLWLLGRRWLQRPVPVPRPRPLHNSFSLEGLPERRAYPRRKGVPVAILVSDADGLATPIPGWVIDRSLGGLGLTLPGAVLVGTTLSIRPAGGSRSVPWVALEVKHCRQEGERWIVGGRFLSMPPWSVLVLFG